LKTKYNFSIPVKVNSEISWQSKLQLTPIALDILAAPAPQTRLFAVHGRDYIGRSRGVNYWTQKSNECHL